MLRNYFPLILLVILVLVFESKSASTVKIFTNNTDVEIIANGNSLGKGDTINALLPEGRYRFTGKRNGCFDDIEWRIIRRNTTKEISISPRPIEGYIAPRMQMIFYGPDLIGASFIPTAGLKFLKYHYAGVDIMYFDNMGTDTMFGAGLEYSFLFETQVFKLHIGTTTGFYNFKIEKNINNAHSYETHFFQTTKSLYTKPQCSLHLGYGKYAAFAGFGIILSEKVLPALECGMSISI